MSFLVIYVDDILLVGNDKNLLNSVKEYLNSKFSMKDLGEAVSVLGIKIYRDRSRRILALKSVEEVQHGSIQEGVLTYDQS